MKPDNPAAFPVTPMDRSGQTADTQPGMSLRDYFAAAALTGMLACEHPKAYSLEGFATEVYMMADHMLAERAKHE